MPLNWLLAPVSLHLHGQAHVSLLTYESHFGVIQAGLHIHVEAPMVATTAGSQPLTWDWVYGVRSGSECP